MPFTKNSLICLILLFVGACSFKNEKVCSEKTGNKSGAAEDWLSDVSLEHPRIFINKKIWTDVKRNCLEDKKLNKRYLEMKARVDSYPENPSIETDKKAPGVVKGKVVTLMAPKYWGREAIETAFVYLMTGEKKYLEKTKKMLAASGRSYALCLKQGMAGGDYHHTEFPNAFAAFDWIYNDLSEADRKNILLPMMDYAEKIQEVNIKDVYLLSRNNSAGMHGYYGAESILWYSGLAGYKDGIADALALKHLKRGYEINQAMLAGREKLAEKDGGFVVNTAGYSLGMYLWADINFFLTWRSATGENIAGNWKHFRSYPRWAEWTLFPSCTMDHEYGIGDAHHTTNSFKTDNIYFLNIADLLHESHPDAARQSLCLYKIGKQEDNSSYYPINIFLLGPETGQENCLPGNAVPEHARLFRDLGVAYMRSGPGDDATYCAFVTGKKLNQGHSHYDQGHFTIYKKGFLALDSGARGRGVGGENFHIKYYYPQTVAHNCILIHMPGEEMPPHWGPKFASCEKDVPKCDGGQNNMGGGNGIAFESNGFYTYIAEDMTKCYNSEKCDLALRQFLFVYPNYFVIFDKVKSTEADYRKEWLFHSQNEPLATASAFEVEDQGGRLFCKTLFPVDAKIEIIGGPGKEFWASGKNWELEDSFLQTRKKWAKKPDYFGAWRVSVSPRKAEKENIFLHVLEVGKKTGLKEMMSSQLKEDGTFIGCEFRAGDLLYNVMFAKDSLYGGHIKISRKEKTIFEKEFFKGIMSQREY